MHTLKRKYLKPGETVKNTASGSTGTLLAEPGNPKKLRRAARWCVAVRTRSPRGQLSYTYWVLDHVVKKIDW